MCKDKEEVKKEITNSAIGSWAGYIYQGLCGIYHVLRLLLEDEKKYDSYFLNLDSYEDFSILDANKKIVSLHQCKDEKQVKQYEDEQKKMLEKKTYLISKGLTDDACQVYFHNAHNIELKYENIHLYQYHNNQSFCSSADILTLISEIIDKFKNLEGSKTCKIQALTNIVDKKVLDVQKQYFDTTRKTLKEIARTESVIAFKEILDILNNSSYISIDKKNIPCYIKTKYILKLNRILTDETELGIEVSIDKIDKFIQIFSLLQGEELIQFLQRINPHQNLSILNEDLLLSICSDEKIGVLYRQIQEIEPLSDLLDWKTDKSRQTPTTLVSTCKSENIRNCKHIYELSPNLDCLWEYDWLVGSTCGRIDSISKACNIATTIESDVDSKNIFLQKEVGILTIEDKKNGKFE